MKKTTKSKKFIGAAIFLALLLAGCSQPAGGTEENHKKIPTNEELTTKAPEVTDTLSDGNTNLEIAFENILSNPNWGKVNVDAISYSDEVYTFDAKYQTGCIIRKIVISEAKSISFYIQTNLDESYDGYLQFLVDGSVKKAYYGLNGNWVNQQFEITAGTHTIEWRRYDEDDRYSGNSPYVSLKNFTIARSQNVQIPTDKELTIDAPEVTDSVNETTNLDIAFDNILSNSNWGIVNPDSIYYKDGIYTFDATKQTGCIKRTIILSEPKRLTFKIKTHLYEVFDGCFQFLIDDEIIQTYSEEFEKWDEQQFEISAGTHTIEWRRYDIDQRYTIFGSNKDSIPYVSLKDFAFKDVLQAVTSLDQNFEDNLDSEAWTLAGLSSEVIEKDPVFAKWPQYGDALIDTHGKVLKLSTYNTTSNITGNSSLTIQKITVSEESALSFDYKCDHLDWIDNTGIYHKNYLRVFLDYNETPSFEAFGNGQMWQNASIILSAGTHTVQFVSGTDDGWYAGGLTNATYIDNITLSPNTIDSVDIYPKGLQETYVNGDTIQFTAKALRSDGSVISDKDVFWTTTGGSINIDGIFSPGSMNGIFTVTATIEGKSASNETVKIHDSDYLLDPVTINGHTFTGNITYNKERTARSNTKNITFSDPTPADTYFSTDGFFVLKGHSKKDPDSGKDTYVYVAILKDDGDDSTNKEQESGYPYQTDYIFKPGDFESRIWLRFGDGKYHIFITEASATFYEDYDGYEGAFKNCKWSGEADSFTWLEVINNTGLNYSADDCAYLMPSAYCQSDDFIISNAFNGILSELPPDATLGQKLQALYDWEARRSHYDFVSFITSSTTRRKRQDAVHVLKYGMAVCEGYADLYTALVRHLGIKSRCQYSAALNHEWTELNYNGAWKMVDITWEDSYGDSVAENIEKMPTAENYNYFLINPQAASHSPNDNVTEYYRSASSESIETYNYDTLF